MAACWQSFMVSSLSGLSPALVLALLLVGLAVLCIEIFILPGFGVAGIVGVVFVVAGCFLSWIVLGPLVGGLAIIGSLCASIGLFVFGFKNKAMRRRLVLDTTLERGCGTDAEGLKHLVGLSGEAKSDLRPAGIALIDGQRVDVVSDGSYIENGEVVRVQAIDGPRVIVARMKP